MSPEIILDAEIRAAEIVSMLPGKLHRFCTECELAGWDAHARGGNPNDCVHQWAGWLAREIWLHGIREPWLEAAPIDGYPTLGAMLVELRP